MAGVRSGRLVLGLPALLVLLLSPWPVCADEVVLRDGRTISGNIVRLPGIAEARPRRSTTGAELPKNVVMIEDGLRRVFVPRRQVVDARAGASLEQVERFFLDQPLGTRSRQVVSAGLVLKKTPFDKFGRRTVTLHVDGTEKNIIQAITEINSRFVQVHGIHLFWDQRLATSSIPTETLDRVLLNAIDAGNADQRIRLARFYIEAGQFQRAAEELNSIRADFPDLAETVDRAATALKQAQARRRLAEIDLRLQAGQYGIAHDALRGFPVEGVSSDILQQVRAHVLAFEAMDTKGHQIVQLLAELVEQLPSGEQRREMGTWIDEIKANLHPDTLPRLEALLNLADDPDLDPADKIALALTGWLLGNDNAEADPILAVSLWKARDLLRRYLREDDPLQRDNLLALLRNLEGIGVERLAQLVALLPPQVETSGIEPGEPFPIRVPATDAGFELEYWVQLPAEYTPHRAYPVIMTLHGFDADAEMQVNWWGLQADRRGYIVLAPVYAAPKQHQYDYRAEAHAAVLGALRDARKRFSIDSDRVFLSGYSMGGDAAWDIGLAHPGVFAGVVPLSGVCEKFSAIYRENAAHLPLYVVGGEKDRDLPKRNGIHLDEMMDKHFNVTYTEYMGRGHESFYEEIHNIFDWMGRQRRARFPRDFVCESVRPGDNRFYWVTFEGLPAVSNLVPELYDQNFKSTRPLVVEGRVGAANNVIVRAGSTHIAVWLSPEIVDFDERISITVNGRQLGGDITPSLTVLLEDFRKRRDRQKLFWAQAVADRRR